MWLHMLWKYRKESDSLCLRVLCSASCKRWYLNLGLKGKYVFISQGEAEKHSLRLRFRNDESLLWAAWGCETRSSERKRKQTIYTSINKNRITFHYHPKPLLADSKYQTLPPRRGKSPSVLSAPLSKMQTSLHESFCRKCSVHFLPLQEGWSWERQHSGNAVAFPILTWNSLLHWQTFNKTWLALLKIGVLVVLIDLFYHVLCALKCMSFSVFSLQTEHLAQQTQFKERETGSVQRPVSNMIL